jgi:hypothetical protein
MRISQHILQFTSHNYFLEKLFLKFSAFLKIIQFCAKTAKVYGMWNWIEGERRKSGVSFLFLENSLLAQEF